MINNPAKKPINILINIDYFFFNKVLNNFTYRQPDYIGIRPVNIFYNKSSKPLYCVCPCFVKRFTGMNIPFNFLTGELYVGCEDGVYVANMPVHENIINEINGKGKIISPKKITSLQDVKEYGKQVRFSRADSLQAVMYLIGEEYENNLEQTPLKDFSTQILLRNGDDSLISSKGGPGGPGRIAYLRHTEQSEIPEVPVLAYNGEKIQESLPSVAMAYLA